MKTYKIIRFRFKGENKVVKTGLTLDEAQKHCQDENTHEKDENGNVIWFDGYTSE